MKPPIKLSAALPIAAVFTMLAAIEVIYFPGRSEEAHLRELRAKAVAISELTAHGAAPGLEFDDLSSVEEQLRGAARDPELEYVAVLSSDGAPYASINRAGVDFLRLPHEAARTEAERAMGHFHVVTPVATGAHRAGTLVAGFSLQNVAAQTAESLRVARLIGLWILGLGLVMAFWNGHTMQRAERLLEENRTARRIAEAASRAKSEFLANMSHELRTPMNGVLGMASLLAATELSPRQSRFVEAMRRSGQTLLAIISDVLDFSKIESGRLDLDVSVFDVGSVVEDVGEALSAEALKKGVELVCSVAPDVPSMLRGDPLRVQQVLMNLVGNAIKFTSRGEVAVRVLIDSSTNERVSLMFRVSDTGVGIPTEKISALFTAFMQADTSTTRMYGGTGLGLAISKRLVELMQGRIGVESQVGRGSTFWFVIPFDRGGSTSGPEAKAVLDGMRALVVDDNTTNRDFVVEVLASWGVAADQAQGGAEALACIERAIVAGRPYDVLLLDMHMPQMDGRDLARSITRNPLVKAPMVLLTSALDHDRADLEALGIRAWLPKPLRQSSLLETLMRVLALDAAGSKDAGDPAPRRPTPAWPASLRGLEVLAAEDNEANQLVLTAIAEHLGLSLTLVGNGREAVDAAALGSFRVVLMDCQMPVMDGYRAAGAIREMEVRTGRMRVPIIAVTAHALGGERQKVLEAGMDDYLTKPVDIHELAQKLEEWQAAARGSDTTLPTSPRNFGGPKRAPTSAILDRDTVEQLGALCSEKHPRFFDDLIEKYAVDARKYLEGLLRALDDGDASTAADLSHSLKGSSRTIGALRVGDLCERLESLARCGSLVEARPLLFHLDLALFDVTRELERIAISRRSDRHVDLH